MIMSFANPNFNAKTKQKPVSEAIVKTPVKPMAWKKTVRSRLNEETFCSSMKKKINASQESSTIAAP